MDTFHINNPVGDEQLMCSKRKGDWRQLEWVPNFKQRATFIIIY